MAAPVAQLGGTPVLILPEKAVRYLGRDAQHMNIMAARVIAEAVRTTWVPGEWTRCWWTAWATSRSPTMGSPS